MELAAFLNVDDLANCLLVSLPTPSLIVGELWLVKLICALSLVY